MKNTKVDWWMRLSAIEIVVAFLISVCLGAMLICVIYLAFQGQTPGMAVTTSLERNERIKCFGLAVPSLVLLAYMVLKLRQRGRS